MGAQAMVTWVKRSKQQYAHGLLRTRFGVVAVVATRAGVRQVDLPRWDGVSHERDDDRAHDRDDGASTRGEIVARGDVEATAHLERALAQLDEYFAGARQAFTVPLDPLGTPFLRRVWEEVASVPYGETRSYGEIAQAIGASGAARAVGRANAINPLAPFVPCHRIVGGDGRLTGYGSGLPMKAWLLRMEDALPADAADYDAWIARLAARSPGGRVYLGIRRTRAYCRPGCVRSREHAVLPARILFSPEVAMTAGFRPCSACAPGG
jgi:methylated-DNA-[protein]-cysteine S-methyltransferase